MITLEIDLSDVLDETHADDAVVVWPPTHREGSRGQVIAPRKRTIPLAGGQATVQVEPGPLNVQIRAQDGRVDGEVRRLIVPEEGPVTLRAMMEDGGAFTYTPEIMTTVTRMRTDAVEAREGALASEGAAAGSAEAAAASATFAGESATFAGESATSAGVSATTSDDAAAVAVAALVAAEQEAQEAAAATAMRFIGTGFPEGKVSAPVGSIYTDTAATAGAIRWIKTSGTGNTGWQVEYGDTGWRTIMNNTSHPHLIDSGQILVRRVANAVEFAIDNVEFLGEVLGGIVPNSFRPKVRLRPSLHTFIGPTPTGSFQISSGGYVNIYGPLTNSLTGSMTFMTTQQWPTTLPGTPA